MIDVKDCANRLLEFAAEPDTPKARNSIDACIDRYRAQGGLRVEIAAAFEAERVKPRTIAGLDHVQDHLFRSAAVLPRRGW